MTENATENSRCKRIADYLPLIRATDGLTLSQVCRLCRLEPTTIQNWIKRGYVPHPVGKKYRERHLARILLISELREGMQIDRVGALLRYINGDADDESDDIITEEALYDLFCEISARLTEDCPPPDRVSETVRACIAGADAVSDEKLIQAMEIMAHTYLATVYKRGADQLYERIID